MKEKSYKAAANWNFIVIALFFTLIVTLVVLYLPNIREFDMLAMKWVQSVASGFPQIILLLINEFGRYHFIWPLAVSSGILISRGYYLQTAMLIIFTQFSYFFTDWLKDIICRTRPCGNAYPGYSFPSGHSLINMCFWGILIYLIMKHFSGFAKYFLITIIAVFIVLVGISRMYLGVHFPTDIIAGMLIGFIFVNLYAILDKYLG